MARLSFSSVPCIIQFSESSDFEFEGPCTQSSSFELILFMSSYSNSKMKACIENFNCKIINSEETEKRFEKIQALSQCQQKMKELSTLSVFLQIFRFEWLCLKFLFKCIRNLYLTSSFSYKPQWISVKLSQSSPILLLVN